MHDPKESRRAIDMCVDWVAEQIKQRQVRIEEAMCVALADEAIMCVAVYDGDGQSSFAIVHCESLQQAAEHALGRRLEVYHIEPAREQLRIMLGLDADEPITTLHVAEFRRCLVERANA